MPTEYSECYECNKVEHLEKIKPGINDLYKEHKKIASYINLPQEIREIIMKYVNTTKLCTCCKQTKLCDTHYKRAQYYHKYYRREEGAMCDMCCWWEVS